MTGAAKITELERIVKLRQMLKKWRSLARKRGGLVSKLSFRSLSSLSSSGGGSRRRLSTSELDEEGADLDRAEYNNVDYVAGGGCGKQKQPVPAGHVAVYVGEERRRFLVRTGQLGHPIFRALLRKTVEEEFGFDHPGALAVPCHPAFFQHLLWAIDHSKSLPPSHPLVHDLLHFYFADGLPTPPPHPQYHDCCATSSYNTSRSAPWHQSPATHTLLTASS